MEKQNFIKIGIVIFLAITLSGCHSHQYRFSGFLNDYSSLHSKGKDRNILIYQHPKLLSSHYNKIIIDPVAIYYKENGGQDLDESSLELLKIHFRDALLEVFGKEFTIVDKPSLGTLRLRTALTNILPGKRLGPKATDTFLSNALLISQAAIEAEWLDAVSGEPLGRMVDKKASLPVGVSSLTRWADVKKALHVWAQILKEQLDNVVERSRAIEEALDKIQGK